jgi:hypothetical protein
VKRLARQIQRSAAARLSYSAALEQAANQSGFENFIHARHRLRSISSDTEPLPVELPNLANVRGDRGSVQPESKATGTVCFDVEVAWQQEFRYGYPIDLDHAWEEVAGLSPKIRAATAYLPATGEWRSYRKDEISKLCTLVAGAKVVITFNGKRWDIPLIGQSTKAKTVIKKLKLLSQRSSQKHHDLCLVAPGKLWDLFVLNFSHTEAHARRATAEDYKSKLIDGGWTNEDAWQASKAHSDAGMTYELWKLWREGSLRGTYL